MVWGKAWRCAVLVNASPRWLGATLVKLAPMATFPWVEERDLAYEGQTSIAYNEYRFLSQRLWPSQPSSMEHQEIVTFCVN